MATARSLFATSPVRVRRPGRWLPPRGVIRGRPTREYNRVYDTDLRHQWVARPVDSPPLPVRIGRSSSGVTDGPARWWMRHRQRVIAADCAVIIVATLLGSAPAISRLPWVSGGGDGTGTGGATGYPEAAPWALGIAAVWMILLHLSDLWCVTALRSGRATTSPIVRRAGVVFLGVGLVGFLFAAEHFRAFLLVSIPLGVAGLLIARAAAARSVRSMRASGALPSLVLVAGSDSDMGRRLMTWIPDIWGVVTTVRVEDTSTDETGALTEWVRTAGADLLVLAEPERFSTSQIAGLAWTGLGVGTDLMVPAPSTGGLMVDPPSAAVRLVGGLSAGRGVPDLGLVAVDPRPPRWERAARLVIDRLLAAAGTLLLLPVVLVAVVVSAVAQGPPVFIENERVGRDGLVFRIWSFRCVASTPGGSPDDHREASSTATRLTPVGRVLRRSGLENVPGLLNVLAGDLALIGPRPVLPAVGVGASGPPWLRPGWTGRWREPAGSDSQTDGAHLGPDLRVLGRIIVRRLSSVGKA